MSTEQEITFQNMNEVLPEGWEQTTLGKIAYWGSGGTPSRSESSYYGGTIPWVKTGDLGNKYLSEVDEFITEEGLANSSAKLFPKGSIVLAMYGATIGKTSILHIEAATNQACAVAQPLPNITSTNYLYYLLCNEKERFIAKGKGGAQPNISQLLIKDHKIPLPPLAEQQEIATRLDDLLAQVDAIKARLDAIPAILKRFRQAVLAAAVSGKLTDSEASSVMSIDKIAQVIGGLTKNSKREILQLKKPYLRVANVYENELRLDDISYIGIEEKEIERVLLRDNDLLVVEGNGSLDQIGRVALWQNELVDCVHQNHIIKVRVNFDFVCPKYLLFYLMSPQGKKEIVSKATSGAGLYTLSISKVGSIKVPLFQVKEQTEIVNRVEQLFAFAGQIEQQVQAAQTRVNQLTQAILAKAFKGELTAAWRAAHPELISGENSAEALLEKIKATQASIKPKRGSLNLAI